MLVLACLLLAAPVPKGSPADAWVGAVVFGKTGSPQPLAAAAGDAPADGRTAISYKVIGDDGDRVRVVHAGRVAWLRKADVLRAADAVEHFTRLMKREPSNSSWPLYRGSALREIGRYDDGIKDYDTLVEKYPTVSTYWNNRASVKISARRYKEAVEDLDKAVEISADSAFAFRNRGHAKLLMKAYAAAIPDLDRAARLDPAAAASYVYRGRCEEHLGDYAAAEKDFEKALELEPLNPLALAAAAWLKATHPREQSREPGVALKLAERACDHWDWKTGYYLSVLAAAAAANGRYDDAAGHEAAALRDPKFAAQSGDEAKERLALYRAGKPYRQPVKK